MKRPSSLAELNELILLVPLFQQYSVDRFRRNDKDRISFRGRGCGGAEDGEAAKADAIFIVHNNSA
jgi:hypothetical protein